MTIALVEMLMNFYVNYKLLNLSKKTRVKFVLPVMCLQRFAFALDQGIALTNEAAFVEQMRSVGKVIHRIRETL